MFLVTLLLLNVSGEGVVRLSLCSLETGMVYGNTEYQNTGSYYIPYIDLKNNNALIGMSRITFLSFEFGSRFVFGISGYGLIGLNASSVGYPYNYGEENDALPLLPIEFYYFPKENNILDKSSQKNHLWCLYLKAQGLISHGSHFFELGIEYDCFYPVSINLGYIDLLAKHYYRETEISICNGIYLMATLNLGTKWIFPSGKN